MIPSIIVWPGSENLGQLLTRQINCNIVKTTVRTFPDGESYVRIHSQIEDRPIVILSSLDYPNSKLLPLLFMACKAKEMKARTIVLVAPYLAYMRQDKEFNPGECVTSRYFAQLLSQRVDHLITVDPHIHRVNALGDLYSIPSQCLKSAPILAAWIKSHVEKPVLLGPDSESKQWVQEIARVAKIPFSVFRKRRVTDDQVILNLSDISAYQDHTPVLVDDIISTAGTMLKAVKLLKEKIPKPPVCLGIHGIFSDGSFELLKKAGVLQIVTTNTIPHVSNAIDITPILAKGIRKCISELPETTKNRM